MKSNKTDSFWPSYTDLMTSLFFVMLVLYVLTYVRLSSTIKLQKDKLAIIETVEENLKPLKKDTSLFIYEEEYKRFTLGFDVQFKIGKFRLNNDELENSDATINKISLAGVKLRTIIDTLQQQKLKNNNLKNVSYLLIISGYASHLLAGSQYNDYSLSYNRAYYLWLFWKDLGIDFESPQYNGLIDLQISGNGWGGVGRFQRDLNTFFKNETKNQRFIIQIIPKIGDLTKTKDTK